MLRKSLRSLLFLVWPPNCRYYDTLLPRLPLSLGHSAWGWVLSNQLSPCWAVPPYKSQLVWGLKREMALELVQLPQLRQAPNSGVEGGLIVTCMQVVELVQSHHGCLVRYLSGAANDAGSLVLGPPPDFAEKSQALSKRGRRMDHRDLVAGAQVRVLHGAWSLARFFFWGKRWPPELNPINHGSVEIYLFFFKGNDHIGDTPRLPLYYDYGRKGVNYETNLIVLLVCRAVFFVWG